MQTSLHMHHLTKVGTRIHTCIHTHTQTKLSPTKQKTFSGAKEQLRYGLWKGNKNTSKFHYQFSFILTAKTVII